MKGTQHSGPAVRIVTNPVFLAILLTATAIVAYAPAWNAGFIWDDDDYVTNNPLLSAPDGLRRIWFSLDSPSQYFPLTYSAFRLEYKLWGLNAAGYHWVNLFLHSVNALLLWRLLTRLRLPGAWLAAAIFALHPVQVESVAWITELKNVLSLLFSLLTLIAWAEFIETPPNRSWKFYALALIAFALALFSKSTTCTLPAALLLILWLRSKRIDRPRLLQLIPFLLMSLSMGVVTIWWERYHQGTQGEAFSPGLVERVLVASRAVWFYLGKLLWPVGLTFSYPRWQIRVTDPLAYAWSLLTIGAAIGIGCVRRSVGRSVETALLFFVAMLSPLLGFIMLYTFRYSFVADHYQYIGSIGPIALAAAGITKIFERRRTILQPAICALILLTLAGLTWRQCKMYVNAETLWKTTLARNPGSALAHNNLGLIYLNRGETDVAMAHFQAALAVDPNDAETHNNMGCALLEKERTDEAIAEFRTALTQISGSSVLHYNLAKALLRKGETDNALEQFRAALAINPRNAQFHFDLANAFAQLNRIDEAINHYQKSLELRPGDTRARYNLANVLFQKGEFKAASTHHENILQLEPTNAAAHNNLATINALTGRLEEAVIHYQKGLETRPDDASARYNLGLVLLRLGRQADAIAQFQQVLRYNPNYTSARQQLLQLNVPLDDDGGSNHPAGAAGRTVDQN